MAKAKKKQQQQQAPAPAQPQSHQPSDSAYKFPKFVSTLSADPYTPTPVAAHSNHRHIVTVDRFFTRQQCADLVASFNTGLALTTTPLVNSKDYAVRVNDRATVADMDVARALFVHLQPVVQDLDHAEFGSAIGLNANLRIYRYRAGGDQFFGQHYDESVSASVLDRRGHVVEGRTHWTLLVYLTGGDGLVGGETVFYTSNNTAERIAVHPEPGLALLHKHGDDCLLHEALPVDSGVKWILRSDLVYPNT